MSGVVPEIDFSSCLRHVAARAAWLIAALAAVAVLVVVAGAASASADATSDCRSMDVPVSLGPGAPADQHVHGTLCAPAGATDVEVLVHGASYNGQYWNWPVDYPQYSYVARATAAGEATFAYDRIGAGQSSHPLSLLLTLQSAAYVEHQVIQAMRQRGFAQVTSIGHSLGSIVTIDEAGTYRDVDRLVVTDMAHLPGLVQALGYALDFYPAALDPQFAGKGLDPGYLTSQPGRRGSAFYSASADPAVIAYDEAHKDLLATTELASIANTLAVPAPLNASDRITAPTLLVFGDKDALFCGPLLQCTADGIRRHEAPYYTAAKSLTTAAIPDTGHDLALFPSADQSFGLIERWIRSH